MSAAPETIGVLIVAARRADRRTLFDALDGQGFGRILSARDAAHARSLLAESALPKLAVLDFCTRPAESAAFSSELCGVPVIGLIGSTREEDGELDLHFRQPPPGVVEWLRSPVDPVEARVRVQSVFAGDVRVLGGSIRTALDAAATHEGRDLLRALAALCATLESEQTLQQRLRRFADALHLDCAMVAAAGDHVLETLARSDRLIMPNGAPDPLAQPTIRLALGSEPVVRLTRAQSLAANDAWLRVCGHDCYAALPLRDAHRNVLGVLLCAARKPPPFDPELVRHALDIAGAQFASALELRHAQAQGRATGLLDALTGLPNRLLFNDRLETTLAEAHRSGEMFALLFVDLDRFKNINDSLGHSVGDQVLLAVSKRLCTAVRGSDTVARYAGDEFTLILRHVVLREDVLRIADKLVRAMEAPLTLDDGSELRITASIGISFYPDDAGDAESLVKHADVAMYNAKGMGRNNYQAYVAVPEEQHRQRIHLEARLRMAEHNDELRVYYQPQIDAQSEDIVGMEALVRWEHPELGMISPAFFIPIAEETGLIIPLGEWVLRRACADCARWQKRFRLPLRVGVNLSALQMMQPNLVDAVRAACNESGLDPKTLDLEVTESISMKSVPNLLETLTALRNLGCGICIDDFGTGQSSLDYIKRFPADRIKIDQSFVRNIGVDPDDEAIVRATLTMAHNLGRRVVAEGVESEVHDAFLREHGCDELQGYLFCRPLSAVSFENLLAERARLFAGAGSSHDAERLVISA